MRTRLTLALLLGLATVTGCGGNSTSSPESAAPPPGPAVTPDPGAVTLAATVQEAPLAGITVCLDQNADLQCGDAEPKTVTDATGGYALALPVGTTTDGLHLVAEIPAAVADAAGIPADGSRPAPPAATPALVLAAPAGPSQAIHALSTLVSAARVANPGQDVVTAEARVRRQARLPADLSLLAAYAEPTAEGSAGNARALGRLLAPAWRAGLQAAPGQPPLTVIPAAAGALEASLARYVDATTGRPYRTVTARTLASETTAVTGAATTCPILPLAQIRIDTAGAAPIVDRENYLAATVTVAASAEAPAGFSATAEIRGRGNSTWLQAPKKPYRLRLTTAAPLLGLPAARNWALLANYFDTSMLRNSHGFCLSRLFGTEYTAAHRFVELTLNGQPAGLYLLTDHMEVGPNRVNLGAIADNDPDPPFLVEINEQWNDEPELMFESSLTFPYSVKSDATPAQVEAIRARINAFEATLATVTTPGASPRTDDLLNLDTLVDHYVIAEYLRNNDSFISSTYLHRKAGGKLSFGPHWDYDLSAGNSSENNNAQTDGWWVRTVNTMYGPEQPGGYVSRLLADPDFAAHVAGRWQFLSGQQPAVFRFLDESAAGIAEAQQRNLAQWPWGGGSGIPADYVNQLKAWLTARRAWLDGQMPARNP